MFLTSCETLITAAPPSKNSHAPPPTESRKSYQSVHPSSVRAWWDFPCWVKLSHRLHSWWCPSVNRFKLQNQKLTWEILSQVSHEKLENGPISKQWIVDDYIHQRKGEQETLWDPCRVSEWESEKNWDCSESPVHFSPGHLNTFSTELEILSDQAESWPGPQSRLHMSWGCELPWE